MSEIFEKIGSDVEKTTLTGSAGSSEYRAYSRARISELPPGVPGFHNACMGAQSSEENHA